MTNIVVFGHSVTAGFWDTEGGWVQRLRSFLDSRALKEQDESLVYYVYNLGVGGDTSKDILERFEQEIERRFQSEEENIIVFQMGENDIQYIEKDGKLKVDRERFKENIEKLIEKAESYGKVIFVGDFPSDPSLEKVPHSRIDKSISDKRRQDYEKIKKDICNERMIPYIDLFPIRREYNSERLTVDGVHPTDKGHKLIYERVRAGMEDKGLI